MKHEWMIDVLSDLQNFAKQHDLDRLAEHIEDTLLVAASELAAQRQGSAQGADEISDRRTTGTIYQR
ncbi:hypothetical protein GCM10007939_07840 [Amylibacter marinus]|uniref:Transposase, Mutator family n=1 Tax=Amylibacter marinus TaxID=1475483 RepID=A0ABQ5VT07_9RHOB|nr:hypothetical protein [Amylibacter marinus]GLQ34501.1 hypothetical protein GCM10007939_07840 [Amylibacter marinus]